MTRPKQVTARAVVRVTLEIDSEQRWGDGCKIDQIMSQAKESAIGAFRNLLAHRAPRTESEIDHARQRFVLRGEPEVISVLVEEERP